MPNLNHFTLFKASVKTSNSIDMGTVVTYRPNFESIAQKIQRYFNVFHIFPSEISTREVISANIHLDATMVSKLSVMVHDISMSL